MHLVIGAGVVGLAVARELALAGCEVVVAEATGQIGNGISARNSGVIHAGLYYPTGSARARHCLEGADRLRRFCASHHVAMHLCGKLVVAVDEGETGRVLAIAAQAEANGVEGIAILEGAEARRLEPNLACFMAMLSPRTGIVDAAALMLALKGDLESAGGMVALHSRVSSLARREGRWHARINDDDFAFDAVVNCAGLGAQAVAATIEGLAPGLVPRLRLCKGSYFSYGGPAAFSRLIYPVPAEAGLGIHLTLDLGGGMRFGPDVEWVEQADYDVDPRRKPDFVAAIRRYWPAVEADRLHPDYAGIRPKITQPGEPAADFAIHGPREHGQPGLVSLFGIESPGLTSSLAIAAEVARMLR